MADWIEKSKVDLVARKTYDDASKALGELSEMMYLALDAFDRCGCTKTERERLLIVNVYSVIYPR